METSLLSRWWKLPRSTRVAAITILGVALAIAVYFILPSCYRSMHICGVDRRHIPYNMAMRDVLRDVAVAESLYFSEYGTYTANFDTLAGLEPDLLFDFGIWTEIDRADAGGWHATTFHRAYTQTCFFRCGWSARPSSPPGRPPPILQRGLGVPNRARGRLDHTGRLVCLRR